MSNQNSPTGDSALLISTALTGVKPDGTASLKLTFDIKLSPDDPTLYKMVTYLTIPGDLKSTTLLTLVSGATYDHNYWDLPNVATKYSLVDAAAKQGYATLNLDLIGRGGSDRPDGSLLSEQTQAYAIHQVVQYMQGAGAGTYGLDKTVLVGHSVGSIDSIIEDAAYHDVSGLVLTGFQHYFGADAGPVIGSNVLTSQDPNPRLNVYPPNYKTAPDSVRRAYYGPTVDPKVLAEDIATKSVISVGEDKAVPSYVTNTALSDQVDVPVLTLTGQNDGFFGSANPLTQATVEGQNFTGSPSFQDIVIPGTGHDLQLSPTAPETDGILLNWISRRDTNGVEGTRVVQGTSAGETLVGGAGGGTIIGGSGSDTLVTTGGTNTVLTDKGYNRVLLGQGTDVVFSQGQDTVTASTGSDTVHAGAGRLLLTAGSGSLNFIGGSGKDTVQIGTGPVTLTAGTGQEVYGLAAGITSRTVLVNGFSSLDSFSLTGFTPGEVTYAIKHQTQAGDSTIISLPDATNITFTGVGHVKASSFSF